MLRQKPANEAAVTRLIDFTNDLWLTLQTEISYNPSKRIETYGVAKRTYSDLKALKVITQAPGQRPEWIYKDQPSRLLALQILDYRLKKTKKQIHVPIPDFSDITDTLKTIGERLALLSVQNEKWLKTHKNDENRVVVDGDLFRVDDQRLLIAGQIASAVYKPETICDHIWITSDRPQMSFSPNANEEGHFVGLGQSSVSAICSKCGRNPNSTINENTNSDYEAKNDFIVLATDDLMSKLLKKPIV